MQAEIEGKGSGGRLAGKVALATGAASGIGQATARRFALEGARVFSTDIDGALVRTAASVRWPVANAVATSRLDVTSEEGWEGVLEDVRKVFGRLDVLVNSAGITLVKTIEDTSLEEWRRILCAEPLCRGGEDCARSSARQARDGRRGGGGHRLPRLGRGELHHRDRTRHRRWLPGAMNQLMGGGTSARDCGAMRLFARTRTAAGGRSSPRGATRSTRYMTAPAVASRPRRSRAEVVEEVRGAILEAAAKVVGRHGYAEASISKITEAAGIAQGTFYLYFESRQALFDQLLPHVGQGMIAFIGSQIQGATDFYDMEEKAFRAFFDYLQASPGFFTILNEAEVAAPVGYATHFRVLRDHYVESLRRAVRSGRIKRFADRELGVIAYMLMAARSYLYVGYVKGRKKPRRLPAWVVTTYMKTLRNGVS